MALTATGSRHIISRRSMENGTLNRPSGVVLPLLLRNRRKNEDLSKEQTKGTADQPSATASAVSSEGAALDTPQRMSPEDSNVVFTAQELQNHLWRTSVAMVELQRQLHRGEESYFEDTYTHGNLFSRWDNFIDAKDIGPGGAASGEGGGRVVGRRMPAEHRWFSGSCPSVGRKKAMAPPPPMITKTSSLSGVSAPKAVSSSSSSSSSFLPDSRFASKGPNRETNREASLAPGADHAESLQLPESSGANPRAAAAPTEVASQEQETSLKTSADMKETGKDSQGEEKAPAAESASTSSRRKTRKRKAGNT